MKTNIEIEVECIGNLFCQPGSKKPNSVERLRAFIGECEITPLLDEKTLTRLEQEYLDTYADDCGDKKHEYAGME